MNEQPDILNAIPELEGDIPASQFMERDLWIPAMWFFIASLVIAGIFLLIWRLRRKHAPAPLTQEVIALKKLEELEQQLPPLRECSLRLSLILRSYLTGETQDPALFETHEEFSHRLDALSKVPEDFQYDTRFLLEGLADLKYSGVTDQDPVRARNFIEQTRSLISHIADARRQEEAAAKTAASH